MHTVLLILALMLPAQSWAMDHYSNVAQDQNGRAISGATIMVYLADTTIPATIYADNGVTIKPNPFTTGIDGVYDFYAADGRYDIKITKFGFTSIYWDPDKTKGLSLFDSQQFIIPFGDTFPVNPSIGSRWDLTNDGGGCTPQTGSSTTPCRWDGVSWFPMGGGGGADGFINGTNKQVTWATAFANAFKVLDGSGNGTAIYTDATNGPRWVCVIAGVENACNYVRTLASGKYYEIQDSTGAKMIRFDPSQATANLKYTLGSTHPVLKFFWIPAGNFEGDGTNCPAASSAVTINSGPKLQTIICGDNNGSILYATAKLPKDYNGGTLLVEQVVIQTAADTNALNGAVGSQCHGATEVVNSTWGTTVTLNANVSGSNKNDFILSSAMTPAGTCAAGDMLYLQYTVNAAGTTTAMGTLHTLGFGVYYSANSLSN